MVKPNGECLRIHREHYYIMNRLNALARQALIEDLGEGGKKVKYEWRRKASSVHVDLLRDRTND